MSNEHEVHSSDTTTKTLNSIEVSFNKGSWMSLQPLYKLEYV